VLGLFPDVEYQDVEVRLEPGDLLAAFSDGLVEAHNPAGNEFGEERLIPLLERHMDLSAAEIEALVLQAVREWTAGAEQEDDLTLVVLKRR
jgi:serine phosphatase RsbU (regulator of sigma subunit)